MDLHRCHRDKFLHIPAQVTDFMFVCPLSRKSSWQLRLKRTSLPIWVSSTSSLGREMRRPPLLPGWMIPCAYISVYPICLPFCGSPVIHFQTAFDFHTVLFCCYCYCGCCCLDDFMIHTSCLFTIVCQRVNTLLYHSWLCLSLSVVIIGRTQRQISRSMNRPGCLRGARERESERETEERDHREEGRAREKTGSDERNEGEGSFCRAKCCNHPPPGRKVLDVRLSQVSGELRGG